MSCINDCKNDCCQMPPYRNDDNCDRCGRTVLTVWYCLVCKHMSEGEGPDYTDPNRMSVLFSWPNPPFKIPFRRLAICGDCKRDITDIGVYGICFRNGYFRGKPDDTSQLTGFLRYTVEQEPVWNGRFPEKPKT